MTLANPPSPILSQRAGGYTGTLRALLSAILSAAFVAIGLATTPTSAEATAPAPAHLGTNGLFVPEVAPPGVDDPISEAEFLDLQTMASQSGMSLEAAIDRYAWGDNFALAAKTIREAMPAAFTGAEIVDANNAWIGFAGRAPVAALHKMDTFGEAYDDISVDVRTDLGFTELELERMIEEVHVAVLEQSDVRHAYTFHDFAADQITTRVVLEDTASDAVLDRLQVVATNSLSNATGGSVPANLTTSVVRAAGPVIGGDEAHIGGEILRTCTSGFTTVSALGVTGIATAGHCNNSQLDDGMRLTYQDGHVGTHGDFQWHTGPQNEPDDFFSGSSSVTQVNRRDVSSVGSPFVGQSLCRNGWQSHKDCQEVRKRNVCSDGVCNLVQMGAHLSTEGDSGAPVFWNHTAYGIHKGFVYDPWPFDREVFSRGDRIDNALIIEIAR